MNSTDSLKRFSKMMRQLENRQNSEIVLDFSKKEKTTKWNHNEWGEIRTENTQMEIIIRLYY